MGNFLSGLLGGRQHKDEGLGLYKSWVGGQSRDLTVATEVEAGAAPHLLERKVDSRKAVEAAKRPLWQKRPPFYTEARERARQGDPRLEEISINVRILEQSLAEIQKADKTAKKVIYLLLFLPSSCLASIMLGGLGRKSVIKFASFTE